MVRHKDESHDSVKFEKSDDFIYGIRVKRLRFKRSLLSRKAGAMWWDSTSITARRFSAMTRSRAQKRLEEVEGDEIDDEDDEMEGMDRILEDEEAWVVPSS